MNLKLTVKALHPQWACLQMQKAMYISNLHALSLQLAKFEKNLTAGLEDI